MAEKPNASPNTHLGEVTWYCDMYFGTLLYVCQGLLGIGPGAKRDQTFLNAENLSIDELWDFFFEVELPNGKLGFDVCADNMYCTTVLAHIETTLPYGEPVSDQAFLNLVADFIEHVRGLPLCDPAKREGAMTEEEFAEANRQFAEGLREIDPALFELWLAGSSGNDPQDEIPF